MHKLKWVKPTEVGSAPQPVTASNPRGAGRKPDGSRLTAQAAGKATYWTPRICRKVPTHNVDGLCERYATSHNRRCVQCAREGVLQWKKGNRSRAAVQCHQYRVRQKALAAVAAALGV